MIYLHLRTTHPATERWHLPELSRVGSIVKQFRLLSFLRSPSRQLPAQVRVRYPVSAWWFWLRRECCDAVDSGTVRVAPATSPRGGHPMRPDIRPGGIFPDYALPDHTGTVRKLSDLQGRDPLILTLARGNYCPKEHQQHLELASHFAKIAVSYTKVVTIATDPHHTLQEFRASVGAQWPFLSDPGRIVQKDLEIQEYTDPDNDPMIPHTLVLKPRAP